MAAVKPGLAKLNIKPQTGSLNAMKTSFASATRAQGVSYGIMAQRSIFSSGVLQNPKMAYSPTIASIRGMLNAPRPMMFAGVMPHQCNNSGDDMMNKFMMGMMALNMVAEMTKSVTSGIKEIKAARADKAERDDGNAGKVKPSDVSTTQSNSLTGLKASYDTASKGIADFSKGYQNAVKGDSISNISSILSNYADLDVTDLDPSQISISELNLNEESTFNDIADAGDKITKDLANINEYSKKLTNVIGSEIPQKLVALQSTLDRLEATPNKTPEVQNQISEMKAQIAKLKEFKLKLQGEVTPLVTKMTEAVEAQKEKLKGLEGQKRSAMDKLCEQAEKNDKQIKENNEKMTKLQSKIKSETNADKKKALIEKYNGLAKDNISLSQAITTAGGNNIKNSKGISANLSNYELAMTNLLNSSGDEIKPQTTE